MAKVLVGLQLEEVDFLDKLRKFAEKRKRDDEFVSVSNIVQIRSKLESDEYDAVILQYQLSNQPFTANEIISIQNMNERMSVVLIVPGSLKGSTYLQQLLAENVLGAVFEEDAKMSVLFKMIDEKRSRQDTKIYYGITDNVTRAEAKDTGVYRSTADDVMKFKDYLVNGNDQPLKERLDYIVSKVSMDDVMSMLKLTDSETLEKIREFPEYASYVEKIAPKDKEEVKKASFFGLFGRKKKDAETDKPKAVEETREKAGDVVSVEETETAEDPKPEIPIKKPVREEKAKAEEKPADTVQDVRQEKPVKKEKVITAKTTADFTMFDDMFGSFGFGDTLAAENSDVTETENGEVTESVTEESPAQTPDKDVTENAQTAEEKPAETFTEAAPPVIEDGFFGNLFGGKKTVQPPVAGEKNEKAVEEEPHLTRSERQKLEAEKEQRLMQERLEREERVRRETEQKVLEEAKKKEQKLREEKAEAERRAEEEKAELAKQAEEEKAEIERRAEAEKAELAKQAEAERLALEKKAEEEAEKARKAKEETEKREAQIAAEYEKRMEAERKAKEAEIRRAKAETESVRKEHEKMLENERKAREEAQRLAEKKAKEAESLRIKAETVPTTIIQRQMMSRRVIGVFGLYRGAGADEVAVSLAKTLSQYEPVTLIEVPGAGKGIYEKYGLDMKIGTSFSSVPHMIAEGRNDLSTVTNICEDVSFFVENPAYGDVELDTQGIFSMINGTSDNVVVDTRMSLEEARSTGLFTAFTHVFVVYEKEQEDNYLSQIKEELGMLREAKADGYLIALSDKGTEPSVLAGSVYYSPVRKMHDSSIQPLSLKVNEEQKLLEYVGLGQAKKVKRDKKKVRVELMGVKDIAVFGAERCCGTTHTALMLADSVRRDYRVALLDLSPNGHIRNLALELGGGAGVPFQLYGVDCYFGIDYASFAAQYRSGYQIVIIDFGTFPNAIKSRHVFLNCTTKYLVFDAGPWRLAVLDSMKATLEAADPNGMIELLTPMTSPGAVRQYRLYDRCGRREVHCLPFCEIPLKCPDDVADYMRKLVLK